MRRIWISVLFLFAILFSCTRIQLELTLDELSDKENYTGSMLLDCSTYMGEKVERILVNGSENPDKGILELQEAGYYRIEIFLKGMEADDPELIRLVILDPQRGETEWGLPPWTPAKPEQGELGDQTVKLIYPPSAPTGISIPLIAVLGEELTLSGDNLDAQIGRQSFRIKRGVGSVQVPEDQREQAVEIDNRSFPLLINSQNNTPLSLSGVLDADRHYPAGSYIHIPGELNIPEGITLSIGSGSFITIAPEVDILNNGHLFFSGSARAPVTVTCSENEGYWGGFIGTSAGNCLEAAYTIFSRSGFHTGGDYSYGHAGRQALFYGENGELALDHCYMIDHIGQIFYPVSCDLELSDCLIQRAKTGGQVNQSELLMERCVFTDFPDDSDDYRDEDNDGLYLNETNAVIYNSVFMYAKDDGLDSGASGGGEVIINSCRFEANFHEGAALSSGHTSEKLHRIRNSLFINCGQGLELGYSSVNHQVEVDSCQFIRNGIGIRYGDCYEMPHHGSMHVANSRSLENSVYDVWNMNREHWEADTLKLSFSNVTVSKLNPMYPELLTDER
ncbi:MAG: hypothetical protein P1P86_04420 [Bacteroidales bacterium]|nr:hypothetical protein [Bacteroidales bacterium]